MQMGRLAITSLSDHTGQGMTARPLNSFSARIMRAQHHALSMGRQSENFTKVAARPMWFPTVSHG